MGMMEEDMRRGWGHPEVDFLTLGVCQRATDLSMRWDMALNDKSPWLQCSRDMNQLHGSTAAGIKHQWIQAGTGLLLSSPSNVGSSIHKVQTETEEVPTTYLLITELYVNAWFHKYNI